MKVTWKNKKKKKKLCLPHLSDLPFEQHEQPNSDPNNNRDTEDSSDGVRGGDSNSEQSFRHSDKEEARLLAKEFQAQGDNLATVCFTCPHGSFFFVRVCVWKGKLN